MGFAVIVLSLAAALAADKTTDFGSDKIDYSIFIGVFSIFTCLATMVGPWTEESMVYVVIVDLLNLVFYFAGWVVLIDYLHGSCRDTAYLSMNDIMGGSTKRCLEVQTLAVFLLFGITPSPL